MNAVSPGPPCAFCAKTDAELGAAYQDDRGRWHRMHARCADLAAALAQIAQPPPKT